MNLKPCGRESRVLEVMSAGPRRSQCGPTPGSGRLAKQLQWLDDIFRHADSGFSSSTRLWMAVAPTFSTTCARLRSRTHPRPCAR